MVCAGAARGDSLPRFDLPVGGYVAAMIRVTACVMALVLALTAQGMAVAKGQPAPVGTMVLCAGGLSVTVHMDAEGNPISAPHLCPDCALAMLDGPIATGWVSPARSLAFEPVVLPGEPGVPADPDGFRPARAPPMGV